MFKKNLILTQMVSSGGNALTPLISVEEVLNIQIDELSDPRSPELVGRGTVFSTIFPGPAEDAAKNGEPTNVKINGSSPQSTDLKEPPSGTLCALKKQRSSNRLSDRRLSESSLESGSMNLTSSKAPHPEPVLLQTSASADFSKSSNKPSNQRINFPHKCCTII